jgi:hypothetical protein
MLTDAKERKDDSRKERWRKCKRKRIMDRIKGEQIEQAKKEITKK